MEMENYFEPPLFDVWSLDDVVVWTEIKGTTQSSLQANHVGVDVDVQTHLPANDTAVNPVATREYDLQRTTTTLFGYFAAWVTIL